MKNDYVIMVFFELGDRFLRVRSDEEEGDELQTTSDPMFAARYSDFVEARSDLRALAKRYPETSFRMDVIAPLTPNEQP